MCVEEYESSFTQKIKAKLNQTYYVTGKEALTALGVLATMVAGIVLTVVTHATVCT